jgi:hypothetical protein
MIQTDLKMYYKSIVIKRTWYWYHLSPVRIAIIKRTKATSAGKDVVKSRPLDTVARDVH